MRILLAGGAGDVGSNLTVYLGRQGHTVVILDKKAAPFAQAKDNVTTCTADLMDPALLKDIVGGTDVVVNLAWSFSDEPKVLFNSDLLGQANLLNACAAAGVKRFIYTSTAGVYGTPPAGPVDETYTCRPERARKPLYAIAKLCAEQLALALGRQQNLPVTVLRFWWAFGHTIGGKHLRELVKLALTGQPLPMVAGAGGAFVSMNDLGAAIELAATSQEAIGNTYNIGSLFLSWKEIGQTIIELTQSASPLQLVAATDWHGPAFLNETWHLSWDKAAEDMGYQPLLTPTDTYAAFRSALANCIAGIQVK
ncbi:NAD-dependent epimerase/dehydratase family protein [Sporomusa termitida]|uniref:HpnA: hopanoid-associated sugar epimerase n=1 Tax=Sporomusa termitida TaxID=2377 RepID=A0A517DQ77_9FIRM|nr:NAD(P)-dependent oxidoreductase [Sporomusa termitida]QDR79477.1 HpnA: hopanoid-associated sugar epimerase [Sporomusa termitida]